MGTMRRAIWILGLGTAIMGCTGSKTDTGSNDTGGTDTGTTDTSTTDTTTDTATTDTGSPCGNGTVDAGEDCDDGSANSPTGSCNTDCTWVGWVTCDTVTGPVVTLDTSFAQPDGTFQVAGRLDGQVDLSSSCVQDATNSVVVEFTLPADGDYLVTTARPRTTSHTALSLRTDCDDRSELSCNLDNAPTAGGAQAEILGGHQGDGYVALIELVDGDPGGWQLSLEPVAGVAASGASCDTTHVCGDGLVCTDGASGSTCTAAAAPTLTSLDVVQSDYYSYRVTVKGTDANHDVDELEVPEFTDNYADTWGDAANEPPIVATDATLTWDGDAFTYVWIAPINFTDTGMGDVTNLTVAVLDRTGAQSNTLSKDYPTAITNEAMEYVDDPCDMCVECQGNNAGFPRYCDPNEHADPNDSSVQIPGLACTWDDPSGTASHCQGKNVNDPPTVSGGTMWWEGPTAKLQVEGHDSVQDTGVYVHITVVYTDATTLELDRAYFGDITWDHGNFVATGSFPTDAIDSDVDHLEILVEDKGFPSATSVTPVTVDWVASIPPTTAGYGEACDLHGWDTVCEAPYVCSPTLSGIPACLDSEAPVLYDITGTYTGGFFPSMAFTFDALDENADWGDLVLEKPGGPALHYANDNLDATWNPSPFGQQLYSGGTRIEFANWWYRAHLQDADGNVSDDLFVLGVPTQAAGEECNTGVCTFFGCSPPSAFCDMGAGLTCDLSKTPATCEEALAPELTDLIVHRIDATHYTVDFTGTDANADASDVLVDQDEDGTVTHPYDPVDYTTPINGSTSFIATFKGTVDDPHADTKITVRVRDYALMSSSPMTVDVPPIVDVGGTCANDDTVNQCWQGSDCVDGACFAYPPQLSDAVLTFSNYRRDATVTITGFDDKTGSDSQLKTASVTLGGQTFDKTLSSYSGTWDGNQFTLDVPTPGVGTGALVGEQFIYAQVTDIGGFEDHGNYFIIPQLGLGADCDVTGTDNVCHAGLACDTGTATCVNDPTDACAGVPVSDATSDVADFDVDSTGNGLDTYPDYASCGANNKPNGKEVAIRYVASQDGTLTITSHTTDSSGYPAYLFVRRDECVNPDAVVACSNNMPNGTTDPDNSVNLDVTTGDVLYVLVDGQSYEKGVGTVTFSY